MTLYYASKNPGIETIGPGREKLTESRMVAAFCLADPLEEPYYWFPCDFGSDGTVQYQELYPNAFKECCEGKNGFIYTVEAEEEDTEASSDIVTVSHPKKALAVTGCTEIKDLYSWLMEEEDMGRFRLCLFESKTRRDILIWENTILRYLSKNRMMENPDCSYAKFVREKLPAVWEKFNKLCGK